MGQALYRKYRSRSFDELVGQEHVTRTLANAIKQGKISHAYLFTGPRGVGKTSIARILAHVINELEYSDKPHLDIVEIDAASNRRIEDVRDLREKVHIAPVSAKYKVYIIDEVHMLTTESFNALLKTLEEPPSHVVFILATTELHKLPATITSRTQRFAFAPPPSELIKKHLAEIAKQEKIAINDDALDVIAEHGDGSFRDSISLLDQVSSVAEAGKKITEKEVAELLGLPPKSMLEELLQVTLSHQPKQAAELLRKLEAAGIAPGTIALSLIKPTGKQAEASNDAAQLLEGLVNVSRSPHPGAKLLAAVLAIAHAGGVENAAAKPVRSASLAAPATQTIIAEPKPALQKKQETTPPKAAAKKASSIANQKNNGAFDLASVISQWGSILDMVKKHSAPLFGTLKTAELRLHPSGALLLVFRYALHSRKIEDMKHKLVLIGAIQEITGIADIGVECEIDANSIPTPLNKTAAPASEEAAAVIDMMGGGEVVEPA